jgi:RecA/RadA recombinase
MATLRNPIDVSKLTKNLQKSIPGISIGTADPKIWLNTGNYAFNYCISGRFDRGIPMSRVTVLAGESGAGKSLVAARVAADAQTKGIYVVWFDTEAASSEEWLRNAGLDVSPESFMYIQASMIDDIAKTINEFYETAIAIYPPGSEEAPKVLFVIDSLVAALTPSEENQFAQGDMKGDMGRKAKAIKMLLSNCLSRFAKYDVGLIATSHTYQVQGSYVPVENITGGSGPVYYASIIVKFKKSKMKEDDEGNKTSSASGILARLQVEKTRFTQPFKSTEVKIPYDRGIDPYSGLVTLFENCGWVVQNGKRLEYVPPDGGEPVLMYRREFENNKNGILDRIMAEAPRLVARDLAKKDENENVVEE